MVTASTQTKIVFKNVVNYVYKHTEISE